MAREDLTRQSEVEHQVGFWSGGADEYRCIVRLFEGRLDGSCFSGNDSGLTHMTYAAAARETAWDIAGLGEVEDIAVFGGPVDRESAAGEGDRRPGSGGSGRRVWRLARTAVDDARVDRRKGAEQFAMDPGGVEARGGEVLAHVGHELRWAAEVCGGVGRKAQRRDRRPVQASLLLRIGNQCPGMGQGFDQGGDLVCKGLGFAIPGRVQPPDVAAAAGGRQRMQHRQDGSDADSRRDQDHWVAAPGEVEVGPRRGGPDDRPGFDVVVQPSTHQTVVFVLDADPVVPCGGFTRKGVTAQRRRLAGARNPDGQVLAGKRRWQRAMVIGLQPHRQHLRGLPPYSADPQRAKPVPPRLDCHRGRCGSLVRFEQVAERLLPAGAERRDVDDFAELLRVAVRQVQQRVDVGDAEFVAATADADDVVTGTDLALGDNSEVEARTMLGDKKIRYLRFVQPHADPKAGDARLGDFEFGGADAVTIADAHLVIG